MAICPGWYPERTRRRTIWQIAHSVLIQAIAAGVLLGTSPVRASEPEHGKAEARTHFNQGAAYYEAGRFREAIREFRLAAARMPSAELWFDIARAHESLGEHALAISHYELYLRDRVDAPDAGDVRTRIAHLRSLAAGVSGPDPARRGLLRIDVARPGARIVLDGREVGHSPLERLIEIDPGRHHLEVTDAGQLPFRAEVEAEPGTLSAAFVELRPATALPLRDDAPVGTLVWVVAGGAGAALATGATAGVLAWSSERDGDPSDARGRDAFAQVALATGVALGVVAVVLYLLEPGDGGRPPTAVP